MQKPRLVQDIMVTRLVTLSPSDHVWFGVGRLLAKKISGAPVVDEGRYLGVFSEKCSMSVIMEAIQRAAKARSVNLPRVSSFMTSPPVSLNPDQDVFEAIEFLIQRKISGAPVLDASKKFLGVFSEKTSMRVLVDAAYDQLPTTAVSAFMDTSTKRVITEDLDLLSAARIFIETPLRRLVVVRDEEVLGQVSRRDVLTAAKKHIGASGESIVDSATTDGTPCTLPGSTVGEFMDESAKTTLDDTDLLSLAQLFLELPYRRIPVVRDGKLLGQVSRRDLLVATHELMTIAAPREKNLLYLSSLVDRDDAPL